MEGHDVTEIKGLWSKGFRQPFGCYEGPYVRSALCIVFAWSTAEEDATNARSWREEVWLHTTISISASSCNLRNATASSPASLPGAVHSSSTSVRSIATKSLKLEHVVRQ